MRVFIYGPAGSGKTTLAFRIGRGLEIPVYHLDRFFHRTANDHVPHSEALEALEPVIAADSWVIEGNHGSAISRCAAQADHVIILHLDRITSLLRLLRRRLTPITETSAATSLEGKGELPFHLVRFVLFTFPRISVEQRIIIERHASGRLLELNQVEAKNFDVHRLLKYNSEYRS